jgi:FtsP/CotA-like multicopper oxidase with cupredoxin domain
VKRPWIGLAGLIVLALAAGPAFAATYTLRAGVTEVTMPGSTTPIPMWGFALVSYDIGGGEVPGDNIVTVPGPKLIVPAGQGLTVYLLNDLPNPASIIIPGQWPPLTAPDAAGPLVTRNASGRIQSFTHETPASAAGVPGGPVAYVWNSIEPGTYLYHSGTHPAVQVQMGLYGAITKNQVEATATTPAEAYFGRPFDEEAVFLYSEIDPALHAAVAEGRYGYDPAQPDNVTSTLEYHPKYFLVNGSAADPVMPAASTSEGNIMLLRFLNAGLADHAPQVLGPHLNVIAEDGKQHLFPRQRFTLLLPAGKTMDALLEAPAAGKVPIFDRRLARSNAADVLGAMYAYLDVLPVPPGAPGSLAAAAVGANQVVLTWNAATGTVDGYRIERTTTVGAAAMLTVFTMSASSGDTVVFDVPDPTATSYTDTTVLPNTAYRYVIFAYNAAGDSPVSNAIEVTTPLAVPAQPTGLTATAMGPARVDLAWDAAADDFDGYRLERSSDGGASWPAAFDGLDPGSTGTSDATVAENTTYQYRLFAYNAAGDSPPSDVATVTTSMNPPADPTGLTAVAHKVGGVLQVDLAWEDHAANEEGYYVERSPDGADWTQVAVCPPMPGAGAWPDTTVAPETTYHYRVRAFNSGGPSGYSNEAVATTPGENVPAVPSNLKVTKTTRTSISLSWSDNSANETGFVLERSRYADFSVSLSFFLAANTKKFTTTRLTPNRTYHFRVRAVNADGSSEWSDTIKTNTRR